MPAYASQKGLMLFVILLCLHYFKMWESLSRCARRIVDTGSITDALYACLLLLDAFLHLASLLY